MITNWRERETPTSDRFLELAESYRQAAMDFCHRIIVNETQQSWANASVVMLLAAHSVELFLKGAILQRSPDERFPPHHRLDTLAERARELYDDSEHGFRLPMESIDGAPFEEDLLSNESPSLRYRYPTQRTGDEWTAIEGFDQDEFFELLETLGEEYSKLPS
ncbi:hypothetical protein GCM10027193_00850 [Arenimonas aestuarii]